MKEVFQYGLPLTQSPAILLPTDKNDPADMTDDVKIFYLSY
jgi:hypothetical protein